MLILTLIQSLITLVQSVLPAVEHHAEKKHTAKVFPLQKLDGIWQHATCKLLPLTWINKQRSSLLTRLSGRDTTMLPRGIPAHAQAHQAVAALTMLIRTGLL